MQRCHNTTLARGPATHLHRDPPLPQHAPQARSALPQARDAGGDEVGSELTGLEQVGEGDCLQTGATSTFTRRG